jgi:hypothetical protein
MEGLQQEHSAPGVKRQLAAVRMLFDWLITGQVLPTNPAAAVRGPKHVVKTGKTPVLEGAEWRKRIADAVIQPRIAATVRGPNRTDGDNCGQLLPRWRNLLFRQTRARKAGSNSGFRRGEPLHPQFRF